MRKSILISTAMVLGVLALLLFGLAPEPAADALPPGPVVLLVEDDTGAFLLQVKQGAQQAAAQAGCELIQETAAGNTLRETVDQWARRGTTAALLLMEDEDLCREAAAAFQHAGVPVVTLAGETEEGASAVMNQRQAGELLAGFAGSEGRVYLFGDAPERLAGALGVLDPERVAAEPAALPQPGEQASVLALTGEATQRLAALKSEGVFTAPLAGMDPGEERVALMASGAVDALVLETPYAMGYAAMEMALAGETSPQMLPYRLVPREEMYEAQHVKLMFPLLH